MTPTVLLAAAALLCGIPVGLIAGLVIGARMYRSAIRPEEFDGGYTLENPPVRTVIWSRDIKTGDGP
jgi:hypothetical protein